MKKRVTILTACALCAVGIIVGASATEVIQKVQSEIRPDFTVKIDGETRTFKNVNGDIVYPMLYEGTTYLPVRAIGEIMGKDVYWFEDDKIVELKEKNTTVTDADVIVPSGGNNNSQNNGNNQNHIHNNNHNNNAGAVNTNIISLEQAKKIATYKAGFSVNEVLFKEAKADLDDGRLTYEIEFLKDGIEYSADILASDGTILSWETDRD